MRYYDSNKQKIIMPSNIFYKLRHGDGYMENNGLFFKDGYLKPPVFRNNGEYIQIELVE